MSRVGYNLKQAFSQMGRNKAMYFTSILAITAMMLILGLFFVAFVKVSLVNSEETAQSGEVVHFGLRQNIIFQAKVCIIEQNAYQSVFQVSNARNIYFCQNRFQIRQTQFVVNNKLKYFADFLRVVVLCHQQSNAFLQGFHHSVF